MYDQIEIGQYCRDDLQFDAPVVRPDPQPLMVAAVAPRLALHNGAMTQDEADRVAAALSERGIIARVARPAAYRFGIRIPLGDGRVGDGREALWDVDGAAGLEAQIMRDGVLVGFVPQIPGSQDFDEHQTVEAILAADYGDA